MNIFYLDSDPGLCAGFHNDKHVVKMILETAQILSSVHWMTGGEGAYKLTHKNHPCCIWARTSLGNYRWLAELGLALCEEYTRRYGRIHKTEAILRRLAKDEPNIPDSGFTELPQAMPDECKRSSAVEAYREYYRTVKRDMCTWKNGRTPDWF